MRVCSAEASNALIGRMPQRPVRSPSQKAVLSRPRGEMTPSPVITARRRVEAMVLILVRARPTGGSGWTLGGDLCQSQQVFQLAAEHKVMVAEKLLRPRLVEVGEEDLGL